MTSVTDGSAASRAGIKAGDVITSIDGEKMAEQNDLFRILDKHQFGDVLQVEVVRDGRRQTVPVRLLPDGQRRNAVRR